MKEIESQFNEAFSPWNISLPLQDVADRRRGKIVEAGWAIWYLFDSNARGAYLDYYASHRMTTDLHLRIYEDGHNERLPTINSMQWRSEEPEEDARLEAEYFARNRRIARMLEAKGFGVEGNEPVASR